jgi:hypothetical protein
LTNLADSPLNSFPKGPEILPKRFFLSKQALEKMGQGSVSPIAGACQLVEDLISLALVRYQPDASQVGQVPGNLRLRHTQRLLQPGDAQLAVREQMQNA